METNRPKRQQTAEESESHVAGSLKLQQCSTGSERQGRLGSGTRRSGEGEINHSEQSESGANYSREEATEQIQVERRSGSKTNGSSKPLKILYSNARSIVKKVAHLEILLNDHDPDLVLICETWCNKDISNAFLNIPGYFIDNDLRLDREDTIRGIGGGLLVYVRDGLAVKPLPNQCNFKQYIGLLVIGKNCFKNIYLMYHSPNSPPDNNSELCKFFDELKSNCLVVGDFNYPGIDWESNTADRKSAEFLHTVEDKFLTQLNYSPSHQHGNILDLIFTDRPLEVLDIEDIGCMANSDHSSYLIETLFEPVTNKSDELILDWKHANDEALQNYFNSQNWALLFHNQTVSQCWDTLVNVVNEGISEFVPRVRKCKESCSSRLGLL